jgi:hypothetical protein
MGSLVDVTSWTEMKGVKVQRVKKEATGLDGCDQGLPLSSSSLHLQKCTIWNHNMSDKFEKAVQMCSFAYVLVTRAGAR